MRLKPSQDRERRRAVIGDPDVRAQQLQKHGYTISDILNVVDDQYPKWGGDRGDSRLALNPLALQGAGGQGQAHDELASPLRTVAVRLDMAAVHFDKIACERQTDAQTAMLMALGRAGLKKRSKMRGSVSALMPIPLSLILATASSPAFFIEISMRPSGGVYLAALLRRLANTWVRRTGSPSTVSG